MTWFSLGRDILSFYFGLCLVQGFANEAYYCFCQPSSIVEYVQLPWINEKPECKLLTHIKLQSHNLLRLQTAGVIAIVGKFLSSYLRCKIICSRDNNNNHVHYEKHSADFGLW